MLAFPAIILSIARPTVAGDNRDFTNYRSRRTYQEPSGRRKSDVQESQWLLKLHTYGLLNNSFQPVSETRVLRTYWRQ